MKLKKKITLGLLSLSLAGGFANEVNAEEESEPSNKINSEVITASDYDLSEINSEKLAIELDTFDNRFENPIMPNYSAVYYYNHQTTVNVAFNPLRLIPKQIHMNHPYYGSVQGTIYPINAGDWDVYSNTWLYRGSLYRIDGSPMPISISEER